MLNLFVKKEDIAQEFLQELFKPNFDETILTKLSQNSKFDINYKDTRGNNFLHKCLAHKKFKSASWLVKNGIDLTARDKNGIPTLELIIETRNPLLLKLFLDTAKSKIDINEKDQYGRTAIQNSTILGYKEMSEVLLEYGADINSTDDHNRNVIFDALSFGNKNFINKLLEYNDLELNNIDDTQNTIMHHPQVLQDDDNAIKLLQAGADATIKNKDGETFLCKTALRGIEAKHIIDIAIEKGNDVNSRVKHNNSILMEIVSASAKLTEEEKQRRKSLLDIAKVFLKQGIDINAINDNNETALFNAIKKADIELVKFLLSAGIDTNIINKNGETALTFAIYKGIEYLDIILLLLKYHADPSIKNFEGKDAFHILNDLILHTHNKKTITDKNILQKIEPSGQYFVLLKEILVNNQEDYDYMSIDQTPIFFEPLLHDHFELFKLYIKSGADINLTNKEGHNIFFEYVLKVFKDNDEKIDFQNNLSMLISSKLDHNYQDINGQTIVHKILSTPCNISLFDILTQIVLFDYTRTDKKGRSVMHEAVWHNQRNIMKRIHNISPKSVNIPDNYGILPMTYSALMGNQALVLLLLELNANIKSTNISAQAIKQFTPMLKNLETLTNNINDIDILTKIETVIEQVKYDFGVKISE